MECKRGPQVQNNPLTWFSYACSVVIVYIHNQLTDLDLKVWTSFSLLSYCIIIVFDRLARLRTQDSHVRALTGMHTRRYTLWQVQAEWRAAVVFPVLLFINLSYAIKDCQQEWQTKRRRKRRKGGDSDTLPFTDVTLYVHLKFNFPFLSNNFVSRLLLPWKCPQAIWREQMHRPEQVRKSGVLWAAYILHLSSHHLVCLLNHTPACVMQNIFSKAVRTVVTQWNATP